MEAEIIWGKNLEELHSIHDLFYFMTWQVIAGDVKLEHAAKLVVIPDATDRHYAILNHPEWVRW